jgi:nucleoside-diphosphate-sugar epimerase
MKVVITGAAGFIGRYLVAALRPEHEVIALVRDARAFGPAGGVSVVEGDLADQSAVARLPRRADAVVHLAQANVPFPAAGNDLFAVNVAATQWLASYAREAGASHFVYASAGNVYAPSLEPLRESSPLGPKSYYGTTKVCSEALLACYKEEFAVCILRIFAPYGPGQKNRLVPNLIQAVRAGDPVFVVNHGQPLINPMYVTDLVSLFVRALRLPGYHVLNAAGPDVVSIPELAAAVGELVGREPVWERRHNPERWNLIGDTRKMLETFRPGPLINLKSGIRRMLELEQTSLPA